MERFDLLLLLPTETLRNATAKWEQVCWVIRTV